MIGLKRKTVELHEHSAEWDECARQTIAQLWSIFGNVACDIRHVGSTSISSIKAKPIIDIAIAVRELEDVLPLIPDMADHGFHRKHVGDEDQVFFSAGDFEADVRTHHIHVVKHDGMAWRNYLNFLAYLNAYPEEAHRYETRKIELATQYPVDRNAYTEGKAELISYLLRKAMVWSFLGQTLTVEIDRPIGHAHKKDIVYPINYGYIPGVLGGDGEELDVYLLGVDQPVTSYIAKIVAIVHRENDIEDKLVACPADRSFTADEIAEQVYFQEKYYRSFVQVEGSEERTAVHPPRIETQPKIRPVCRDDIPACVSLIRTAFFTVAQDFGFTSENAPQFTAFATTEERLVWQYQQGHPMFVLQDEEGRMIGYYSLCEKDRETVELNNLCVLPEYRHRKYGRALLLDAFRYAMIHGYRHMTIGIVEENKTLRAWYKTYGFVHVGKEKFDFFSFTCGYMKKQLYGDDV